MGISLGKADPRLGQLVDVGGKQIIRTVAPGVEGSLIIGKENDHVGLSSQAVKAGSE